MPLTAQQKSDLQLNINSIQNIFESYKHLRNFMGVYFSNENKAFITFLNLDQFPQPSVRFSKQSFNYACTFISSNDFTTQYTSFINT